MKLPVAYNTLSATKKREVRKQYCELQDWKCTHCGYHLLSDPSPEMMKTSINLKLFPNGFLKYPIHLHHSHKTGLTLGAVHSRCNAILWQYHGE